MGNASYRGFAQSRPTCAPPAQTLEVRKGQDTDPLKQYLWDLRYIDAPVLRWYDSDQNGTVDDTLYHLNDANFNVTAVVDGSDGDVIERYEYTPYGQRRPYRSAGSNDPACLSPTLESRRVQVGGTDQAYGLCDVGHQGLLHDKEFGLIHNRARTLHPALGRWTRRDPLNQDQPGGGYQDGMSLYEYCRNSATTYLDPSGNCSMLAQSLIHIIEAARNHICDREEKLNVALMRSASDQIRIMNKRCQTIIKLQKELKIQGGHCCGWFS